MGDAPLDRDAEQLRRLGYAQQLLRDMGGFANFALSFSIISGELDAGPSVATIFVRRRMSGSLIHGVSLVSTTE